MNDIKAVFWDVDATLLDQTLPEKNAIRRCFEEFGFGPCTDNMLSFYPAINRAWWDKMERKEKTKEEITIGRFEEFLSLFNLDTSKAEEFNDSYMKYLGDTICFLPNAYETVKFLKGKVKQYIVTNGLVASQEKKLKNSGLDLLVDGVFVSQKIGYDKPDKEFFDYAIEKTGLKRSQIMIVGDSLTTDMKGGNNASLICCWYNPQRKENKLNLKIDYEISDLKQVLDIIK